MEVIIKGTAKEIAGLVQAIQDRHSDWLSNIQFDTSRIFSELESCRTPESQQQQLRPKSE